MMEEMCVRLVVSRSIPEYIQVLRKAGKGRPFDTAGLGLAMAGELVRGLAVVLSMPVWLGYRLLGVYDHNPLNLEVYPRRGLVGRLHAQLYDALAQMVARSVVRLVRSGGRGRLVLPSEPCMDARLTSYPVPVEAGCGPRPAWYLRDLLEEGCRWVEHDLADVYLCRGTAVLARWGDKLYHDMIHLAPMDAWERDTEIQYGPIDEIAWKLATMTAQWIKETTEHPPECINHLENPKQGTLQELTQTLDKCLENCTRTPKTRLKTVQATLQAVEEASRLLRDNQATTEPLEELIQRAEQVIHHVEERRCNQLWKMKTRPICKLLAKLTTCIKLAKLSKTLIELKTMGQTPNHQKRTK